MQKKLNPDRTRGQNLIRRKGGKIVITFTATSEPEVLNWILSLGAEAKLVEPAGLVEQLRVRLQEVEGLYLEK